MRVLLLLWLAIISAVASSSAFAQTAMYPTPAGVIPTDVLGPFSTYPRMAGTTVSSSVAASLDAALITSSGKVAITGATGAALSVPVTVKATLSAARIAAAATGCSTAAFGNPVAATACAATIAGVAQALKDAGLGYGPCPAGSAEAYAFVCKAASASIAGDAPGTGYYYNSNTASMASTPQGACNNLTAAWWNSQPAYASGGWQYIPIEDASYTCTMDVYYGSTHQYPYNKLPLQKQANAYPVTSSPPDLATFTGDVSTALKKAGNYNGWYDNMSKDFKANPTTYPAAGNPFAADTPVTVTAPQTDSPSIPVSTQTQQQSDGSVNTIQKNRFDRTIPQVTGDGTLGGTKIDYPTQTITTTTTTNNVTNQTTTNTNTTYQSSTTNNTTSTPATTIPTDYAREATLETVEKDLNTDNAPTLPDQNQRITDAHTKNQADFQTASDAIQAAQKDKSAWFSWVWTPPVGSCQKAGGTVGQGIVISWDPCDTVNMIRDILGWLMAVYSAIEIYNQIFRARV